MVAIPGLLVLWSGTGLRHDTHRIPPEGFTLGRDHADASDDRISGKHVKLGVSSRWLIARDEGSRNGTWVGGASAPKQERVKHYLPVVIRAGRTVGVVVPDIRRYEGLVIARDPGSVDHALEAVQRELDDAARAEENVTIEGPEKIGMSLAQRYAAIVGGGVLVFDPRRGLGLDDFLSGTRPRTVILVLTEHALVYDDLPAIRPWLETDVRFVTLMTHNTKPLSMLEPEAIASLRSRVIEVWPRFDEVPRLVVEIVRAVAPETRVHATVIETVLRALQKSDEARMLEELRVAVQRWATRGEDEVAEIMGTVDRSILRGGDVRDFLSPPITGAVCVAVDPR